MEGNDEAAAAHAGHEGADIYGEDGAIRANYLAHIGAAIADRDTLTLKEDVSDLHQSELGDLLEALMPEQRRALVELMGSDFDFSALTEVDEAIRLDIVDSLPNDQIAQAVQELDSDDAVYILRTSSRRIRSRSSARCPTPSDPAAPCARISEETAGRRMQAEFVAVPPFWSAGQTIDYMREDNNLPDHFGQIFVVDPTFKLLGRRRPRPAPAHQALGEERRIMHETSPAIPATMIRRRRRASSGNTTCSPPPSLTRTNGWSACSPSTTWWR